MGGRQFEGMEDDGPLPPWPLLVLFGLCLCVFAVPGMAMGCVCGCVCHPCVVLFGVLSDTEMMGVLHTMFYCSVGWMMLPVFIIVLVVMVLWNSVRSAYELIQQFLCTCLPPCPVDTLDEAD